jgi:hypothetical protein
MSDVTRILSAIDQGDPNAAEQLLPLVYDELRKLAAQRLAHEKPGQTLQATALVHEAFLRLVGNQAPNTKHQASNTRHQVPAWNSRNHSLATAENDWAYAKCCLRLQLADDECSSSST